jgi:hypothetical protein
MRAKCGTLLRAPNNVSGFCLQSRGIGIVRIRNEDFIRDSMMVEEVILAAIRERP